MTSGYLSPKLELRELPEKGGQAVYARAALKKNELLAGWGGRIATLEQVQALPRRSKRSRSSR